MNIKAIILSGLVAFSALQVKPTPAEAHGRGAGAAIAAGALILGLGIAAAAEERRHRRWRHRHFSDCDRYGCYYYDRHGTEHYRGDRIYREYDRHWRR